jgi:hypothetical protein
MAPVRRLPKRGAESEVADLQERSESGARRIRTADLLGAIQALCQLSYSPLVAICRVFWPFGPPGGVEVYSGWFLGSGLGWDEDLAVGAGFEAALFDEVQLEVVL